MGSIVMLMPGGLLLLNLYALLLVIFRGPLYKTRIYRPMVLNIGLSLMPAAIMALTFVVLVIVAAFFPSGALVNGILAVGGVIWLLMLPNSAYLVTELNFSHRRPHENVPLWYDIMLVLTLAMSGVFNTLANVAIAQLIYAGIFTPAGGRPLDHPTSWFWAVVTLVAVAFGIYLGRSIRFNSWDLMHPVGFVKKLGSHFNSLATVRQAVGFTVTHSLFLAILYMIVGAPWLVLILGG